MRHRLDLGLPLASDECIVANTNNITMGLWLPVEARARPQDEAWLPRHRWWLKAATRLSHGEATTTLDG